MVRTIEIKAARAIAQWEQDLKGRFHGAKFKFPVKLTSFNLILSGLEGNWLKIQIGWMLTTLTG